jgi:hypothetical protein
VVGDRVVRLDVDVVQRLVQVKAVLHKHNREVPPHWAEPVVSERTIDAGELGPVQADALVQAGRM